MKNVSIVFRTKISQSTIDYTIQNIKIILDNYVEVTPYFLDELKDGELIKSDAYLVFYEEVLPELIPHVEDISKVVVAKRNISKKYLDPLHDIPFAHHVLVIGDSKESAIELTYALYELGLNHVFFHPYAVTSKPQKSYDSFKYCVVTDNAFHLLPKTYDKIINIKTRELSFGTFRKLMYVLDINDPSIHQNLFSRIENDFDANICFIEDYFGNYLKDQLLTNIVENFAQAVVLFDKYGKINYLNKKGFEIFGVVPGNNIDESPNYDSIFMESAEFKNRLISIGRENYMAEKQNISMLDQVLGFCLILQDEKNLRDRGSSLNCQLKKKGYYAKYTFDDIIHGSHSMNHSIKLAKQAAPSDYTILLRGESGTGKELFAQSIHNHSHRANAPFVAINCAALPENLLESELFGYEPGAFTGANKNGKVGLFEQAQHGTIFLDEIGSISPNLQSRLLRVIQEKQIMRIGSDKIINVDVRIIAATNSDLEKKITEGKFREDLFYRISVISLNIAPLRDRPEDILPLFRHFADNAYDRVSDDEKALLMSYQWPGNVRELENAASYYKLLGILPDYLCHSQQDSSKSCKGNNISCKNEPASTIPKADLKKVILEIVAQNTCDNVGIGRMSIVNRLCDDGYRLSEGKVKAILIRLQSDGLIISKTGRGGSCITEKGLEHLSKQ